MNARLSAAATSYALLAVVALLPPGDLGCLFLFVLIRHQERTWDRRTVKVKRAAGRPRRKLWVVIKEWRVEIAVAIGITAARAVAGHLVGYLAADALVTAAVGSVIFPGGGGWAKRKLMAVRRQRS